MTKSKWCGMYIGRATELVSIDYLNFTQRAHIIYFH